MTTRAASDARARYGAIELKDSIQLYWMMGLGIAILIHLCVIASYKLAALADSGGTDGPFVRRITIQLPIAPINPTTEVPINIAEHGIKNTVGTAVPVPDASADPEQTVAPNVLFNPNTGTAPEGVAGGTGEAGPIVIPETAPEPFVPVEVMPRVVRSVTPVYPEVALRAGLEGTVHVKIWVDREGKPREVSVVKSDMDVFNDAAVAAAKQILFTPAYMNGGPVSVWVTMPFRFRMADRH
jgi:TonB family protein